MRAGHVLTVLRRRKLVAAVGLLVSVVLAVLAASFVGPTYSAAAVVVLLPPSPQQGVQNPYLYLGGLNQARDVVQSSLSSEQVRTEVQSQVAGADYTVLADPVSSGPMLDITATAPTAAAAKEVLHTLVRRAPETMTTLQDRLDISTSAQIRTLTVAQDAKPKPVRKSQIRAVIAALALGLTLTVLAGGLVEGLTERRRRSRREEEKSEADVVAAGRSGRALVRDRR